MKLNSGTLIGGGMMLGGLVLAYMGFKKLGL